MCQVGAGAARLVRVLWRAEQGLGAALAALGAGLGAALTPAERQALTLALYARAGAELRAPFPGEAAWWTAHLPPPPARLLVAGAGAGAEVVALRARGHAVAATEPVPRLAAQCAQVGAEPVWAVDHEGLAALAGQQFAAVLFGWGSFTHVLTAAGRRRVVQAAATLTAGPLLLSHWTAASAGPPPRGRWVALGRALGGGVGRARGIPPADERFFPWCGFGALIEAAELAELARLVGRRLVVGEGPLPHAALLPEDGDKV